MTAHASHKTKAARGHISVFLIAFCLVALVIVAIATVIGAWYWLLLSIPLLVVTVAISAWCDTHAAPSPILKGLKTFFVYASAAMLIVGVECAVFRDVNMYDSQVHSYEEHVGMLSEFIEAHLSASFKTLCAITVVLIAIDRMAGWKLLKGFSWMHSMIGRASIMLAILTSFTFLNVEMVDGLKPGWLSKRLPEVNELVNDLGQQRTHELRLALVKKKIEGMTDEDRTKLANFVKAASPSPSRIFLMKTLAVDEGDITDGLVVKDKRYTDQLTGRGALPEDFSFHEMMAINAETKEIKERNEQSREAILEMFKSGMSSFLPDDLQPVLKEFADSLLDGAIDMTAETIFPKRSTGTEQLEPKSAQWHMDKPPDQLFEMASTEINRRVENEKMKREESARQFDREREAWAEWKRNAKEMGIDVDHPEKIEERREARR